MKFNQLSTKVIFLGLFLCTNALAQLQTVRTYDVRIVLTVGDGLKVFEKTINPAATLTSEACSRYRHASQMLQTSPDQRMSKKFFDEIGLDEEIYNQFFYAWNKIKVFDLHRDYLLPMVFDTVIGTMASDDPNGELGLLYAKWSGIPDDRKKLIKEIIINADSPAMKKKVDTLSVTEKNLVAIISKAIANGLMTEKAIELHGLLLMIQSSFAQDAEPAIYDNLKEFMLNQVVPDCNKKNL